MEQIVPTIHGAYLQTCQYMKRTFVVENHTTLNEKFGLHDTIALAGTDMPFMQYVAIGNGGHEFSTGTDGIPLINSIQHLPTDAALYNHLPFVLRALDNDLTPAERAGYRMRVIETYEGVRYAAYYLKVLDLSTTVPQKELREVNEGIITTTPFASSVGNLNPTPPVITPGGVLTTSGNSVAVTSKVAFDMDTWEIEELLNASVVKYGDDRYAIISEIALVSGLDKVVSGDFNGTISSYTDVIAAQICAFMSSIYPAKYSTAGINTLLDIGAVEALLLA